MAANQNRPRYEHHLQEESPRSTAMSHTRYPVRPIVTDVTMTCLDAPPAGGATVPTTLV